MNHFSCRLFLFLLVAIFLSASCNFDKDTNHSDHISIIDPQVSTKRVDLHDIIKSITFIPLEEGKQSYITDIHSADYTSEYIIFKRFNNSSLIVFDWTGRFLFRISPTGEGPLEIQEITSFVVNRQLNKIFISDGYTKKVVCYDLSLRKVVEEWNVDVIINAMAYHDNYYYCLAFDPEHGYLKVYDENFNLLGSEIDSTQRVFNIVPSRKPFVFLKNNLYLNANMSDTIYLIEKTRIRPMASIGVGKNSISGVDPETIAYEVLAKQTYRQSPYLMPWGHTSIIDNVFIIPTLNGKTILWSKDKNKMVTITEHNIPYGNLISQYSAILRSLFFDSEGYLYSFTLLDGNFYRDVEKLSENGNPLYDQFKKLIDEYPEDMGFENAIILKIELKDGLLEHFL